MTGLEVFALVFGVIVVIDIALISLIAWGTR
jgi:hypothetical protein